MNTDLKPNEIEEKPQQLLWTTRQTSAALNIGARLLWSLTNSGEIPSVRIGKKVLYLPSDLQKWIESRRVKRR
jgi:excisionase family DNA binding protein